MASCFVSSREKIRTSPTPRSSRCAANTDPNELCGKGLHVATLPWVMREWRKGYTVLLVEFWADDIACIPYGTDGKFRLHRCRVVGEKDVTKQVAALTGGAK